MKIALNSIVFILLNLFNTSYSQETLEPSQEFTQEDLNHYTVSSNTYNFWWHKYKYRWFPEGDTLPYFVDEAQYKGVLNYGIEFSAVDRRNFNFFENFAMHNLDFSIEKCVFNPKDSIVQIEGIVKGGLPSNELPEGKNNVDIFIGKRKDTISPYYFNHLLDPKKITIKYKGKKISNHIVLDTFPSFYIDDYEHFRTIKGSKRKFKIASKIDKNSILSFGLINSYSKIVAIGEMIFSNKIIKPKNKSKRRSESSSGPTFIIRNNIQVLNANQEISKVEIPNYYLITRRAENHILRRQFGKAKEQYNILLKKNKYIFSREMHNAVRVAILSRDLKTAKIWCEKLALKGATLEYFDAKIFDRIKKNGIWQEFLKKYPELNSKYKEGLNHKLIDKLRELVLIDQKDYIKNSQGSIESSELLKTTEFVDGELINIIEQEGFPTEEKIGSPIIAETSDETVPEYFTLFIHSYQSNSTRLKDIKKIISEATKDFDYDSIRDNLNIFKNNGSCLQIYKGNLYNDKTCLLDELLVKKIAFRFNNEHGFIVEGENVIVIPYEPKNELQDDKYFKDRFKFIMKLTDDWFFYEKL